MNKQLIVIGVLALVVGGGIGYFVPHAARASGNQNGNFTRTAGAGNFMRGGMGGAGGGFLTGTVAAKDAGSLTIDTRDGSSHVVLLSPETTITKSAAGTLTDIVIGSNVLVTGSTTNGTVTASVINLR